MAYILDVVAVTMPFITRGAQRHEVARATLEFELLREDALAALPASRFSATPSIAVPLVRHHRPRGGRAVEQGESCGGSGL